MKINTIISKTISSLLLLFIFLFNPFFVFSELTPTETPTPTIVETPTPTPTPSDGPLVEEHINEFNESNSASTTYPDEATPSGIINTGDNANIISSNSALLEVTINNINDTSIVHNQESTDTTGNNTLTNNIDIYNPITLKTGDAESSATISTIVNTNVVGLNIQPIVYNLFTPLNNPLTLNQSGNCAEIDYDRAGDIQFTQNTGNSVNTLSVDELSEDVGIYNTNNATIENNVNLTADSGHNDATGNIGETSIDTGDATSTAHIFTMANTNLVGVCGVFGVINIFEGGEGDIILPYDEGYVDPDKPSNLQSTILNTGNDSTVDSTTNTNNLTEILNENDGYIETDFQTTNETGDNSIMDAISFKGANSITTGNAESELNTIDFINNNFVGNNFLILKVTHFGHFKGKLIGWTGGYYETPDYFLLYLFPENVTDQTETPLQDSIVNSGDNVTASDSATYNKILDIENINTASISNNINLNTNTGDNQAGRFNPSIQTGDATSRADVITIANTNVVGDNWYVMFIDILQDFFGNIVFPKPDLSVVKTANLSEVNVGDTVTYSLLYSNVGQMTATDVTLVDTLPTGVELLSTSMPALINKQTLTFSLSDIVPNQTGLITITVKVTNDSLSQITNNAKISSKNREQNLINNESSNTIVKNVQQQNNDSVATPSLSTILPTNTPTPTLIQYVKTYRKVVSVTIKNTGNILGVTSNPYCSKYIACYKLPVIDSIAVNKKTIPLTALLFYIFGVASTLLISRYYFNRRNFRRYV